MDLAITNVGDLLFENKITNDKNAHPINNVILRIPEYQRPYKWTAKNVNQLLDDIMYAQNNNKEVYRVGTLILHKVAYGNETFYDIVDGQQRTITFSLMLYALMNLIDPTEEKKEIPFISQNMRDNPHSKFNVGNNFRALSRRINTLKDDSKHTNKVKELFDYVKNNCQLIVIITDDVSEAFQFFDSQNARGKARPGIFHPCVRREDDPYRVREQLPQSDPGSDSAHGRCFSRCGKQAVHADFFWLHHRFLSKSKPASCQRIYCSMDNA